MDDLQKIAVLIDADNTQLGKLEKVMREISTYGRVVVKRAYGNWKKDVLKNWENEIKRLAIKPVQQFDYVSGKNATDMAIVIDAMDLLNTGVYDAFVLVASDSDYTPIAIKLRESGVFAIGVGEKKTPEAFRNACDEFLYLENMSYEIENNQPKDKTVEVEKEDSNANINEVHALLKIAYEKYQDDDGYVNVSSAGTYIKRTKPDFDLRTYGFLKLPDLIKKYPDQYEVKQYKGKGTVTIFAYKCKV
jgi:uncharacterized LabA/DUF88 family protein